MAARTRAGAGRRNQALALLVGMTAHGIAHGEVAKEEATLGAVTVTAQGLGTTTEGTQSYTTGKTKTATPLSLSLRDTPQSVSVVTQQRIEDQGLQTILDVVNNATGVSVNRYETNRAQFNARGFEINSLQVDGVPTIWEQPWSSGEVFSSLAMYDRVEVVRGATGLMTGAGDPSAAINLVHKRANSKELTGAVELNRGSWRQYGGVADVATPLNSAGTVRGRVVAEYADGDNWVNLLSNKRDSLYGTVDVDLGPSTVLWFGVSHQENETDSPMWGGLPVWYSDGSRTHWARSKTTSAKWSRWDSTYDNYFANLEHRFDNDWKLKASYSRGERSADSYLLYLYGAPAKSGAGMGSFPGSYKTKTVQDDVSLQASGPFKLLGRSHELAFGYAHSAQDFGADSRAALSGYGGVADFNSYDGSFPEPAWGPLSFYEASQTTQQGLYSVARFNLADPLKLIVGARVSDYEKKGLDAANNASRITANEVTPYAGLIYDIDDNVSAYVSYTDIFLPQSERTISKQYLAPIVGKSYETGVKGEFLDGRLNASVAIFRILQDNLATPDTNCAPCVVPGGLPGELPYVAGEGATSKGFELEVSGELAQGWNATAGYTQFKAKDAAGADFNSIYPRKLLRTFTSYRLPGALNKLTVGGGVNWQGRIYTSAANPSGVSERIEQKAYSLVNLMARYDISKQVSAQLNVSNLLDEKYFDIFDAYGALTYGAPRSVTASVKYKF